MPSNQAIKDCGKCNLGKILIEFAAKWVTAIFKQKVAYAELTKSAALPGEMLQISDFALPAFTFSLFALCLERSSLNSSQRLQRESAPIAKLLTNSKMTSWMTASLKVERLREARYQHARQRWLSIDVETCLDGDNIARWDKHGDKVATLPKTQNKGTTVAGIRVASTMVKKGTINHMKTNED